jgi:hypothetical protein
MRQTSASYLRAMRDLLRVSPNHQHEIVVCRKCRIRFLTAPCNSERQDMHCPFGCRTHHQKSASNRRSTDYYQTDEGKAKKRQINADRSSTRQQPATSLIPLDLPIIVVEHLRQIFSRLDRRSWSREEVDTFLRGVLRQRSLDIQFRLFQDQRSSPSQPP